MKLTIKEIKEKAEVKDKCDFPATVKKVYDMRKKDMPYAIGTQNIVVKDDTDEITVGSFIKVEEDAFDRSLEGKKVQVSGEYSTFQKNGKLYKNISKGKILVEGGNEKPKQEQSSQSNKVYSDGILGTEGIRLGCLQRAIEFLKGTDDSQYNADSIIEIAKMFEIYVTEKPKEKKPKPKDDLSQVEEKPLNEKDGLIKSIEDLAENKGKLAFDLIDNVLKNKNKQNLEDLNLTELRALQGSVDRVNEDQVPF